MTTVLQPNTSWRGDPTFLPDVLKLFGVETKEVSGWLNRGHGDFGSIQGIMVHHTEVHHADQVWVNTHGDVAMGEPGVDPVWQPRPEPELTDELIEEEVEA